MFHCRYQRNQFIRCCLLAASQMMGDAIEDAMDSEENEEESEAVVNQVLDEIGIEIGEKMVDVPGAPPVFESGAFADTCFIARAQARRKRRKQRWSKRAPTKNWKRA